MAYEIELTDHHPTFGGKVSMLYGGRLDDAITKAERESGAMPGVSALIRDELGRILWTSSEGK